MTDRSEIPDGGDQSGESVMKRYLREAARIGLLEQLNVTGGVEQLTADVHATMRRPPVEGPTEEPIVDFVVHLRKSYEGGGESDMRFSSDGRVETLPPEAVPEVPRRMAGVRNRIFAVVGAAGVLAAVAVGVLLFHGKGRDSREDARPVAKAQTTDMLPSPPAVGADAVVEDAREKAKAALEADEGPPDTLEVGGEVGILEKLPENCFWGRLSKSKCILALTYRTVVAPDGTEVMQKLVFVFSPDCRSCFVLNPKPKQPPSKQPPFSGGIYFSNDGGKSFTHTLFPQTLTDTTHFDTHANPKLQKLLLMLALSGPKEGEYGETLDKRHLPARFYNLSREDVLEMMGISPTTAERLEEECAESLRWICSAEQRKVQLAAKREK